MRRALFKCGAIVADKISRNKLLNSLEFDAILSQLKNKILNVGGDSIMKIINAKYFLAQVAVVAAIAFVVAVICMITGFNFDGAVVMFVMAGFTLGIIVLMMNLWGSPLSKILANKTIEKNAASQGFANCHTFNSLYGIIKIDVEGGKFAVISYWNPTEFQVGNAAKIENIVSDYIKAPLGGTTGVYFQFMYEKTRIRCYTFAANRNPYSLQSAEVLEAQSKADTFADLLKKAKENATGTATA